MNTKEVLCPRDVQDALLPLWLHSVPGRSFTEPRPSAHSNGDDFYSTLPVSPLLVLLDEALALQKLLLSHTPRVSSCIPRLLRTLGPWKGATKQIWEVRGRDLPVELQGVSSYRD